MAQKHGSKQSSAAMAETVSGIAARLHQAVAACMAARDLPAALKQLALLRLRCPNDPSGTTEAAALLHRLDRHDDAEMLLANGMKRAPAAVAPAYAQAAMLRAHWPEAALRWTRARALRPDDPACLAGAIAAALLAGHDDDAAALAAEASGRCPAWPEIRAAVQDAVQTEPGAASRWQAMAAAASAVVAKADIAPPADADVLRRQGYAAAAAADWPAAEAAWRELRACAPLLTEGWVHGALALRRLDRADDAKAMLEAGLTRLPMHPSLLIGLGYNASEREDWETALPAWTRVRAAVPDVADGWVHGATALERLHRDDEAETLMAEAVRRLPANRAVLARQAYLAVHRADRAVALGRWQHMAALFENDAEVLKGIAHAQ